VALDGCVGPSSTYASISAMGSSGVEEAFASYYAAVGVAGREFMMPGVTTVALNILCDDCA
jgi:hypothetical protein